MPGKPLTLSLGSVYGSVAEDLKRRIGDAQAAQAGPPIATGVVPATDAMRVNAWNARNPEATDQAMLEKAVQQYQQHLAAGMRPDEAQRATAEDLTHFRYGQRLALYSYGQVDFREQVKEAERLRKLAARETTPDPPEPPPTMPSAQLTSLAPAPAPAPALPGGGPPVMSAQPIVAPRRGRQRSASDVGGADSRAPQGPPGVPPEGGMSHGY